MIDAYFLFPENLNTIETISYEMAEETILQHWIFTEFALPFLLVFAIVFGILEKTSFFGKEKKQLNAIIAFVIGLIFVAALDPKLVVSNLILFLTVSLVVVFVGILLWGFIAGGDGFKFSEAPKGVKTIAFIAVAITVIAAVLWATGVPGTIFGDAFDFLFQSDWSGNFWTNTAFVLVVIVALAMILKGAKPGSS